MTLGKISLIGEKSDFTPQKCKKSAKSAVKTAKKSILREKCAAPAERNASASASKRDFGGCRHLWTAEEQLAAASKGGKVKALRAAILDGCAKSAAENNLLNKLYHEAITEPDPEIANQKMQLVERAAKFIGATFDQSPDAKQKLEIDGKMDNTLEVKISEA